MQDELHHSRVRARLRAKALRTRSKSQNKVLLLRIVAHLDSLEYNSTMFGPCLCVHRTAGRKYVKTKKLIFSGSRRSRNRSRGQLLVKNSKATTLQFESDFDFETANAQFKDDITKETSGMFERQSFSWGWMEAK